MPVRAFHGAVFVRLAAVVARRRHAVVRAQRRIACRGILSPVPIQVAIGRREAVAAVLERRPAEAPKRVLQPLGQGREALPAQHHVGVGEGGVGQTEVVQAMIQRCAGDRHAQAVGVGEVRQPQLARRMSLTEDDFLLRTVHRAPLANATLKRAANAGTQFRMTAHQLLEQRHRTQARCLFQQRNQLLVENPRQRIGPAAAPNLLLAGRKSRIRLDTVGRRGAEAGLGRRRLRRVLLSNLHVKPHLVIGNVTAWHRCPSLN